MQNWSNAGKEREKRDIDSWKFALLASNIIDNYNGGERLGLEVLCDQTESKIRSQFYSLVSPLAA